MTASWLGALRKLQILDLTASKAAVVPDPTNMNALRTDGTDEGSRYVSETALRLLPALTHLSVSGCPLNTAASSFLLFLTFLRQARVDAAGCNITSDLDMRFSRHHGQVTAATLDLSKNRIRKVAVIPAGILLSLAENELPLSFEAGVLTKAVERGIRLDLTSGRGS